MLYFSYPSVRQERESDGEGSPVAGGAGNREFPSMPLDDAVRQAQSQACAFLLRGIEGIKDAMQTLGSNTESGVGGLDPQLIVIDCRGYDQLSLPLLFRHGLVCVGEHLHQHLLQLVSIDHGLGEVVSKVLDHSNVVDLELVCQQIKGLEADGIDIDVSFFQLPLACKTEEVCDNFVTTLRLLPDLLESRAHFRCTDIRGNEGFGVS